ncbi:MAG: hybrid sensor histidine kinase/response regulator [bacterium]|nr:hybrid sensor histidine kinase/response regulator [bacterium]
MIDSSLIINILLVDDRPENLYALESVLEEPGLNLIKASSGDEALRVVLEQDFALILLDVQMPGMDGFEVAELLRSNDLTKRIPIIFVTAISKEQRNVFKGYEAGAVDYIFKPLDQHILKSKVRIFSELKRIQMKQAILLDEIRSSNEKLKRLDSLKSEFVATASHELRTPLAIIREFLSLVLDEVPGPLNEDQTDCLSSALTNCDRLASLINDLLDLEQIESGKIKLRISTAEIPPILKQIIHDFQPRLMTKGQKLELVSPEELPTVYCDSKAITQVLVNLIGNAHKFTQEGGRIELRARLAEKTLLLSVVDNGPGISDECAKNVFDKFTQLERSDIAGPGTKGTGLGLSIARELVELHGGDLVLESTMGEGCSFSFGLPLTSEESEVGIHLRSWLKNSNVAKREWAALLLQKSADYTDISGSTPLLKQAEGIIQGVLRQFNGDVIRLDNDTSLLVIVKADKLQAQEIWNRLLPSLTEDCESNDELKYVILHGVDCDIATIGMDLDRVDFKSLQSMQPMA